MSKKSIYLLSFCTNLDDHVDAFRNKSCHVINFYFLIFLPQLQYLKSIKSIWQKLAQRVSQQTSKKGSFHKAFSISKQIRQFISNYLTFFFNFKTIAFDSFCLTQVCDKLGLPPQIKYFSKKAFTLFLMSKEECNPQIYDSLIVACLTFTLNNYSHFSHIIQIIWQGLKEKQEWSHITQSDVHDFENQLKNQISINEFTSPYDFVLSIIDCLSQIITTNQEELLVSCIDLAITIPESIFYDAPTLCFSCVCLVFELKQLNFEEKSVIFSSWPLYKAGQVNTFFNILRQKYHFLIQNAAGEEI